MRADIDRRRFLAAAGATGLVGLAGCSGGPSEGGDGADGDDESGEDGSSGGDDGASEPPATIGIVYSDGGLGDNSFNDAAQQGLFQAESEYGIAYDESQPEGTGEFNDFQQRYAGSTDPDYDLVSCIGFNQTDALAENAPQFPDQDFMIVDSVVDADNVASYTFKEHEGSYLAGLMASLLTTRDFSAGFRDRIVGSTKNPGHSRVIEHQLNGLVGSLLEEAIRIGGVRNVELVGEHRRGIVLA